MQSKFGTLANTKTDLSEELLQAEEDKLKVWIIRDEALERVYGWKWVSAVG